MVSIHARASAEVKGENTVSAKTLSVRSNRVFQMSPPSG